MVDSECETYEYTEMRPREANMDPTNAAFIAAIVIIVAIIGIYIYLENKSSPTQIGQ